MDATRIISLYSAFAAIATAANLITQAVVVEQYRGPFFIEISILAGTAIGLPLKYVLDKQYIFRYATINRMHDGRLFVIYTLTGVVTTALFWGIEYAFHMGFASDSLRYLGGAIGLTVGYVTKYRLDKRFVFVSGERRTFERARSY